MRFMEAETLNCPMCGSPASPQSTRCDHCGARLATVACPSCFGMMFVGSKFCSHCGAQAARTELPGAPAQLCPRCRVEMNAVVIGKTNLRECPRCFRQLIPTHLKRLVMSPALSVEI